MSTECKVRLSMDIDGKFHEVRFDVEIPELDMEPGIYDKRLEKAVLQFRASLTTMTAAVHRAKEEARKRGLSASHDPREIRRF